MNVFRKYFLEHPSNANENYFTHAFKAITIGSRLITFGLFEYIHAIIPGIDLFELFGTKSQTEMYKLFVLLDERSRNSKRNDINSIDNNKID